jgi:hypothetical protein
MYLCSVLYKNLNDFDEMKPSEIAKIIKAKVICNGNDEVEIDKAFSSDLMSDVLKLEADNTLLITGLANVQAVRTAEMSDITCIVFARNKRVTEDMIAVAKENNMVLMQTPCSVYRTSGELYKAGLNPVF